MGNCKLAIEVDLISRIRNADGQWNFYSDEDIVDGMIVFEGLSSFEFTPPGFVPSDWIEFVSIEPISKPDQDQTHFRATLSLGAIDEQGIAREITLTVCANSIHLEDPLRPGTGITD